MPIVPAIDIVKKAYQGGYSVVQINTNGATYDITRAIVEVAGEVHAPVILGAYEANIQYRGFAYAGMQMLWFARNAPVPVAIHLDHGHSAEACGEAIAAGFTSVMIDGSHLPVEENIAVCKQVVGLARKQGVTVEGEVGELQKLAPDGTVLEAKNMSDPEEVRRMSRETGIDMLAVGIGNAHGFYKGQPDIRLDLLEKLAAASAVPLVLHGTTGLADETVRKCIAMGMAKLNLGTLIRTRYMEFAAEVLAGGAHQNHPWRFHSAIKDRLKPEIRHILEVSGSCGKA
jgi:ketose-bisphosphate aldolase